MSKKMNSLLLVAMLFLISLRSLASGLPEPVPPGAPANGRFIWPSSFKIVCGDIGHKIVFDPHDSFGAWIDQDVSGLATQVDRQKLPGAWTNGVGYNVQLNVQDASLTGQPGPVARPFVCYAKQDSENFTCFDDGPKLSTVPDFNSSQLNLPTPLMLPTDNRAQGGAQIGVATSIRVEKDGIETLKIFSFKRTVTCVYSLTSQN